MKNAIKKLDRNTVSNLFIKTQNAEAKENIVADYPHELIETAVQNLRVQILAEVILNFCSDDITKMDFGNSDQPSSIYDLIISNMHVKNNDARDIEHILYHWAKIWTDNQEELDRNIAQAFDKNNAQSFEQWRQELYFHKFSMNVDVENISKQMKSNAERRMEAEKNLKTMKIDAEKQMAKNCNLV